MKHDLYLFMAATLYSKNQQTGNTLMPKTSFNFGKSISLYENNYNQNKKKFKKTRNDTKKKRFFYNSSYNTFSIQ